MANTGVPASMVSMCRWAVSRATVPPPPTSHFAHLGQLAQDAVVVEQLAHIAHHLSRGVTGAGLASCAGVFAQTRAAASGGRRCAFHRPRRRRGRRRRSTSAERHVGALHQHAREAGAGRRLGTGLRQEACRSPMELQAGVAVGADLLLVRQHRRRRCVCSGLLWRRSAAMQGGNSCRPGRPGRRSRSWSDPSPQVRAPDRQARHTVRRSKKSLLHHTVSSGSGCSVTISFTASFSSGSGYGSLPTKMFRSSPLMAFGHRELPLACLSARWGSRSGMVRRRGRQASLANDHVHLGAVPFHHHAPKGQGDGRPNGICWMPP